MTARCTRRILEAMLGRCEDGVVRGQGTIQARVATTSTNGAVGMFPGTSIATLAPILVSGIVEGNANDLMQGWNDPRGRMYLTLKNRHFGAKS